MKTKEIDILVHNNGSVFSFEPLTKKAMKWIGANLQLESWQWMGNMFCIESRFAHDLAAGMMKDGLELE